jgi:hypothetical protein
MICLNIDQVVIIFLILVSLVVFLTCKEKSFFRLLDNNLTGDNRLIHLKDRMRQCQKVFFNLKSALNKIEKQRQIFLRRQQQPLSM